MAKAIDYIVQSIFEPSLTWVLNHPIISLLAVAALIFFAARNYRMLWSHLRPGATSFPRGVWKKSPFPSLPNSGS